ncbi:MAG: thioredoxin family protein [Phototrophicaceae bacterium]
MLEIKVLGSGCSNCQRLERETRAALDDSTIAYELSKVTDYADIASYGVMQTPALVMNETVLSTGKIPKQEQILAWAQERVTA